jgi:hypothetical protein
MLICPTADFTRESPFVSSFPVRPAAAAGARVTTAFTRVIDKRRESHVVELRAATLALVARLKGEGCPPEHVLIALKQAIGQGGWWPTLIPGGGTEGAPPARANAVYSQVFEWFLEGYFGLRRSE